MYVRIRNERDAISFANAAPTTLLRRVLKCLFARFSNFFFFFFCFIKSLLLLYIGTFKSAHLDERHHGVVDAHSFPLLHVSFLFVVSFRSFRAAIFIPRT